MDKVFSSVLLKTFSKINNEFDVFNIVEMQYESLH